jgi:predicted metal-dependent hydrolase
MIDEPRTAVEALVEAQRLLDAGLAFYAHEVLEDAWKAAPADEHELWRGLAQLAVGLTHAARGNREGALTLLRRSRRSIGPYRDDPPHGVDVAGLLNWADAQLAALLADPGLAAELTTPRLVN